MFDSDSDSEVVGSEVGQVTGGAPAAAFAPVRQGKNSSAVFDVDLQVTDQGAVDKSLGLAGESVDRVLAFADGNATAGYTFAGESLAEILAASEEKDKRAHQLSAAGLMVGADSLDDAFTFGGESLALIERTADAAFALGGESLASNERVTRDALASNERTTQAALAGILQNTNDAFAFGGEMFGGALTATGAAYNAALAGFDEANADSRTAFNNALQAIEVANTSETAELSEKFLYVMAGVFLIGAYLVTQ